MPGASYLVFDKYGTETVEQLERGDDVTLDQYRGCDCCYRPTSCTDWHLVEPLLQRELSDCASSTSAEHVVHIHSVRVPVERGSARSRQW